MDSETVHHLTKVEQPRRLQHKKYIPWSVSRAHAHDGIARALRAMSGEEQGVPLDPRSTLYQVRNLREILAETDRKAPHGWVVDYNSDEGFFLVPRKPSIDDPSLPIRRPPTS